MKTQSHLTAIVNKQKHPYQWDKWTKVEVIQLNKVIKEYSSPGIARDFIKKHALKNATIRFVRN